MKIDGKKLALTQETQLSTRIKALHEKPILNIISLAESKVSDNFISIKMKKADRLGIKVRILKIPSNNTAEILSLLNDEIRNIQGGVIIQLPIFNNLSIDKVLDIIPTERDVDMLNSATRDLWQNKQLTIVQPPIVLAVQSVFQEIYSINYIQNVKGKNIVLIGDGLLVGKPLARWFYRYNIPCDQINLETPSEMKYELLKKADIIISGIGVGHSLKKEHIKTGAVVIDCGTSEYSGEIVGDVDPSCYELVKYYTPVPGGVGPLVVMGLFENLVSLYENKYL